MPSIACACGSAIDLSQVPHSDGFSILPEFRLEDLTDSAESLHKESISPEEFRRGLFRLLAPLSVPSPHAYQCRKCGRLAVLRHPSDSIVSQWYIPDQVRGEPASQLRRLWEEC